MSAALLPDVAGVPSGDVLAAARDGESSAVELVAVACRARAYRLALHLLGNAEEARDVAQDAVVRVLGALPRFDPRLPLEPWLARIVRNLVRDRRRRRRIRRHEPLEEAVLQLLEQPSGSSPEERAGRLELQRLVWREVQALPYAHREVVVLRDYLGLSYDEIAAALRIPRGTVMSRLHRARTGLRQRVGTRLALAPPNGGMHD